MIARTRRRLEKMELAMGIHQRLIHFPDPLEALSAEERTRLRPYLEARIRGDADGFDERPDVHRLMYHYLGACIEQDRLMREAGVPMPSLASILGDRSPRNPEADLENLRQRFAALEGRK